MKKLPILLVVLCLVFTVSANAPLVIDNADVLTEQQELDLSAELEKVQATLNIDVVFLTELSLNGLSSKEYADDYYDNNGYGADGVLMLLDMEQRLAWISTSGSCITPVDVDAMEDVIVPYLSNGEYYQAFKLVTQMVCAAMQQPESNVKYEVNEYGNAQIMPIIIPWYHGLWQGLIGGLILGGIVVAIMAFGMRNVRSKGSAADYVKAGSLRLTCQVDRYLYQTVTKRPKPKNNSSSGGVHRSSSGRSHGGGGMRF